MKEEPELRIIWAMDPTTQSVRFYKNVAQVLRQLRKGLKTVIEPVHILRIAHDIPVEFAARWAPEFGSNAEASLIGLIHKLKVRDVESPHILFHNSLSTRGAVDTLSDYAKRSGANLIVAQTHGKKGVSRLFLGSFAETLLFRSEVPVMLVGPGTASVHSFRHILFPTDLGPHFLSQLNHVIELARTFQARVTLFHSVQHPIEPTATGFYSEGPYGPFIDYIQKQLKYAHRKAESAMDRAQAKGVELDYIIDPKGLNVWENILKIAKAKKTGLIAMEAESGPFSSALLGSTTRQVVRRSPCPVWVLKHKAQYLRAVA